jgi:hypothetical protein
MVGVRDFFRLDSPHLWTAHESRGGNPALHSAYALKEIR